MEDYKKRYEQVLAQAKKELQECDSLDCDAARQIFRFFPELKESMENKIIDALKCAVYSYSSTEHEYVSTIPKGQLIAWLERQGEKKEIDYGEELKKCRDNPLYFFDKYIKIKFKKWKSVEWTEEDEKIVEGLVSKIRANYNGCSTINGISEDRVINWLKSIKKRMKGEIV